MTRLQYLGCQPCGTELQFKEGRYSPLGPCSPYSALQLHGLLWKQWWQSPLIPLRVLVMVAVFCADSIVTPEHRPSGKTVPLKSGDIGYFITRPLLGWGCILPTRGILSRDCVSERRVFNCRTPVYLPTPLAALQTAHPNSPRHPRETAVCHAGTWPPRA